MRSSRLTPASYRTPVRAAPALQPTVATAPHAASATGPACKYACTGAHAGEYSPRRLYHTTVTQHGVPGATLSGYVTVNVVRPVCPSSRQPNPFVVGGLVPEKLRIIAPSAL